MAGTEFEKTAFFGLINQLEVLDTFPGKKMIIKKDPDKEYLSDLETRHGLPPDQEAEEIVLILIRKMGTKRNIPEPLYSYIYALVCDIMENNCSQFDGGLSAFLSGMTLGEII